jgi:excisionase family DNA binding protein
MTDRIVIPLPGVGSLVLDVDTYRAGLVEGAKTAPECSHTRDGIVNEPLLDADQLAIALGIPATWIEQKAREGVIPSLEFGRWRRFRRSEVEEAVRQRGGRP